MTTLTQIQTGQAQKEVTANENFGAASPSAIFARKYTTTTALTWGYYGGQIWTGGTLTAIADGTVLLTNAATNYVEATLAGVVSANTSAYTAGRIPLYRVVTSGGAVSSYTDDRAFTLQVKGGGPSSPSFADAEVPSGTVDGVNAAFTLANAPSPVGSLMLFVNGVLQKAGGVDYTLSGTGITLGTAPLSGALLIAYYRY